MKAELKAKWVEALRSGEYEQGEGALKKGNSYCCLGVLCSLAEREITGENRIDGLSASETYEAIIEMIGTPNYEQFTQRNDGTAAYKPHSFTQLADYIEANIPADDHSVADASA